MGTNEMTTCFTGIGALCSLVGMVFILLRGGSGKLTLPAGAILKQGMDGTILVSAINAEAAKSEPGKSKPWFPEMRKQVASLLFFIGCLWLIGSVFGVGFSVAQQLGSTDAEASKLLFERDMRVLPGLIMSFIGSGLTIGCGFISRYAGQNSDKS